VGNWLSQAAGPGLSLLDVTAAPASAHGDRRKDRRAVLPRPHRGPWRFSSVGCGHREEHLQQFASLTWAEVVGDADALGMARGAAAHFGVAGCVR